MPTGRPAAGGSREKCDVVDLREYRAVVDANVPDCGSRSVAALPSVGRAAILNMMLDAVIAAAREPSHGGNVAFDVANTNAVVSAIEGVRRAVIIASAAALANRR